MHIFLIAAAPISYIYALILRGQAGEPSSLVGVSVIRGMVSYLIELGLLLLLERFAPRTYSGIGAFFFSVLYDFSVPILGSFLLYLWLTPDVRGLAADERQLSLFSFVAGVVSLAGIMDTFVRADYFGVYELFLLPALRVTAMLLLPVLYRLFVEETFWVRYLYIVAIVALPFALASVFYLVAVNMFVGAILAAIGLFLGAGLVTVFVGGTAIRARG